METALVVSLQERIDYLEQVLTDNGFIECPKCGEWHGEQYICPRCGFDHTDETKEE